MKTLKVLLPLLLVIIACSTLLGVDNYEIKLFDNSKIIEASQAWLKKEESVVYSPFIRPDYIISKTLFFELVDKNQSIRQQFILIEYDTIKNNKVDVKGKYLFSRQAITEFIYINLAGSGHSDFRRDAFKLIWEGSPNVFLSTEGLTGVNIDELISNAKKQFKGKVVVKTLDPFNVNINRHDKKIILDKIKAHILNKDLNEKKKIDILGKDTPQLLEVIVVPFESDTRRIAYYYSNITQPCLRILNVAPDGTFDESFDTCGFFFNTNAFFLWVDERVRPDAPSPRELHKDFFERLAKEGWYIKINVNKLNLL